MARILKQKDINFYEAFAAKTPDMEQKAHRRTLILVPILLGVICLLVFGIFEYKTYSTKQQIAQIQSYINNPDTATQYAQAQSLGEEKNTLTTERDTLTDISKMLSSMPTLTAEKTFSSIYAVISGNTAITGMEYNESTGVLTISAQSLAVTDAPTFVQGLRSTGLFSDVGYTGYGSNSEGLYQFDANCVMKGGD